MPKASCSLVVVLDLCVTRELEDPSVAAEFHSSGG